MTQLKIWKLTSIIPVRLRPLNNMHKKVLDVGNCNPDHSSLTRLLQSHFEVEVSRTHGLDDTLASLQDKEFDLVLVNRVMDRDGSSGLRIIERIKADPHSADTPVMMITNYDDHQQTAVAAGALQGFGKSELNASETLEKLKHVLG